MGRMTIVVVGTGYVGMSLSVLLAQRHDVVAVDIDQRKVDLINNRVSPIEDAELEHYLASVPLTLHATTVGPSAYADADFVVVATPTDYDEVTNYFDTSSIEAVVATVAQINPAAVIVIKSTVPVGYTEKLKQQHPDLHIIFSPEFLRESGDKVQITEGPFAGLEAIYDMAKGEDRCLVFLDMLGKQQRIIVEETTLRPNL